MRLELGDKVQTSDGQEAGTIDRLVLDPRRIAVRTVVLHRGILLGRSVEVPLSALDNATEDALRLTCTADQMKDLPPFYEGSYTTQPPAEHSTAAGAPADRLARPLSPGVAGLPLGTGGDTVDGTPRREIEAAWRRQDAANAVLGPGSTVRSRDGEKVGTVHGLIVDPISGQASRVLVRRGFLGGEDVELPAAQIAHVDDGALDLSVTVTDLRT